MPWGGGGGGGRERERETRSERDNGNLHVIFAYDVYEGFQRIE